MNQRRVLVTGAAGFIGEHLCRRLANDGAFVHGAGRGAAPSFVHGWSQGDLRDAATLRRAFDDAAPEIVFHLAGIASGSRDLHAVAATLETNLVLSVSVLTEAVRHGSPRVILAGSLEEPEADDAAAISPYAAAKHAQLTYARMFHTLYRLPVVTARLFMVYGPNQDGRKLIPYVIKSLLHGDAPALSSGQREVDWVYVDDAAAALLRLGTASGIEGRSIDVGSGELASIRTVVELLAEIIAPEARIDFGVRPDRPFERVRTADATATEALIGWRARTPLREGLEKTVAWYRQR